MWRRERSSTGIRAFNYVLLVLFRFFADEIRGCRVIVENEFGNRTVENIP
jgi:hypothetical protein